MEVWPENWLVIELLQRAQWQWVSGMVTARVGIEQAAAWAMIDRHPDAPDDQAGRWEVFDLLLIAAGEALAVWNDSEAAT